MKIRVLFAAFTILFLFQFNFIIDAQVINTALASFLPLTGKTWEGDLLSPDGEKFSTIVLTFESIGKGDVVKMSRLSSRNNTVGEGFFYWNDIEGKIAFFFIEQSGVFQTGTVTWNGDTFTIEGTMTWPTKREQSAKQSYEFKNTFELTPDGTIIDKWFMNAFGPWRPGHVITFNPKSNTK